MSIWLSESFEWLYRNSQEFAASLDERYSALATGDMIVLLRGARGHVLARYEKPSVGDPTEG